MRVTGGVLRGRQLRVPPRGVRPTQDRVREALFAILGERVIGSRFLDLCAGSGAVGLEAWSRGAAFVCWVESDRRVFATLEKNVRGFCAERIRLVPADAGRVLKPGFADSPFDIVFADPPYAESRGGGREGGLTRDRPGVVDKIFEVLADSPIIAPSGILIIELGSDSCAPVFPGWALTDERVYGRSRLCFYGKH